MASISDNNVAVLRARIEDAVKLCDKRQFPCFYGFLDEQDQAEAALLLTHRPLTNFFFAGGYDEAERKILAVYPDYMQPEDVSFPISVVAFLYREERRLTHRDFLGTLLSAGVRRDTIGDILCGNGVTVVFLREEISPFICSEIKKIGGEGVAVVSGYSGPLPLSKEYKALSETIASPRLDGVVKALIHSSRDEAARLIRLGLVSLNHRVESEPSCTVNTGDVLSVRGQGRFLVDQIGPPTKKGRLVLQARKCL